MSDEALQPTEPVQPTTSLAPVDNGDLVATGLDQKDLAQYITGRGFLPYLQLCGASTDAVKEGKSQIGTYALVHSKDRREDLGKSVNIFILALRLKAFEMAKEGNFSFFDPKSADFKRVVAQSGVKDSGCMAGPEFLLYIPVKQCFCTFFMCSMTAQNESPALKALLNKAATLNIVLLENKKKQKWHATQTIPCTVPLDPPDLDELAEQRTKFCNPKSSSVEKAAEESAAEADRVR